MDRRSSKRTPRKRYNLDPFEGIDGVDDDATDDEQQNRSRLSGKAADEDSADEFRVPEDNNDVDMDEDSAEESSSGSAMVGDDHSDDAGDEIDSDSGDVDATPSNHQTARKHDKFKIPVPEPDTVYTRGVLFGERHFAGATSKETRRLLLFGPTPEDYLPVRNALAKWPRLPCIPSRGSGSGDVGGYARSLSHKGADCEGSDADWKWYASLGHKAFNTLQQFQSLTQSRTQEFVVDGKGTPTNVVLGPASDMKFFGLETGTSAVLSVAWRKDGAVRSKKSRTGFVLNLGAGVHCLEWVPNQRTSLQYLTASVRSAGTSEQVNGPPAFTPGPPCQSSIQIWELCANGDGRVEESIPPKLRLVICATWGEVRALKWCPVTSSDSSRLGLLATVWGDGCLRVLDIAKPPTGEQTEYVECQKLAFEGCPSGSVFTCVTWLSSSVLAAGCVSGYVAVYDLADLGSRDGSLRPKVYAPISSTYISSIDSAWPSHPHILLTASMNGLMFMTDLRQPQPAGPAATVTSQRIRSGTNHFIWNDYAQCAFSVDDNSNVRCHPLRRFFSTMTVARAKSITTAIACSRCHPFMLVGTAGGEVLVFNPVPRVMNKKAELWQYTWLQHEWRRPTTAEQSVDNKRNAIDESLDPTFPNTGDAFSKSKDHSRQIGTSGLSRITDGSFMERITLQEDYPRHDRKLGANYTTIFEEKTAVTASSWNPNLHVGGWVAVGMCDGLVHIEDISI